MHHKCWRGFEVYLVVLIIQGQIAALMSMSVVSEHARDSACSVFLLVTDSFESVSEFCI